MGILLLANPVVTEIVVVDDDDIVAVVVSVVIGCPIDIGIVSNGGEEVGGGEYNNSILSSFLAEVFFVLFMFVVVAVVAGVDDGIDVLMELVGGIYGGTYGPGEKSETLVEILCDMSGGGGILTAFSVESLSLLPAFDDGKSIIFG